VLLAGCPFPKTSVKSASLTVSIKNNINARTLLPPISMDAASYTVIGDGPNGATFSRSTSGDPVTVEELPFGTWTVTVNALNKDGTVIGQGQAVATVSPGQNTTLAITVTPLGGTGDLNLSVTWTASLQNPSIRASLQAYPLPPDGSAPSLDFAVSGNQASYSSSTIAAGYYTLTMQLMENNFPVMGAVEVVRIVSGQITSGVYDFSHVNRGTLVVNITPALANPIPVSISGVPSTVAVGTSVTATASVSDGTANVLYVWYLNGVFQATGPSYTFGSDLNTGYYRLDVTAFTADGIRAGSATAEFQVIKAPANVAGYWDITITLEGQPPMAPSVLYFQQTGSTLDSQMGDMSLSGSIDGPSVTFAGSHEGSIVTFTGTVSGDQITGIVSAPGIGQGTFNMVRSTPTGHLDVQGFCNGVPLAVNTQYAETKKPEKTTTHFFRFDLNIGGLLFSSSELSVNYYTVKTNAGKAGEMAVSVWQNGPPINASEGFVNISSYSGSGIKGDFNVSFPDGSNLNGSFDLVFDASGTASVQGSGMWSAAQAPTPTFSNMFVTSFTGFAIGFFDNQLDLQLFIMVAGDLGIGDYTMPNAAWMDVQLSLKGGPETTANADLPGTLHITSFSATGIAGSFNTGFSAGGTIAGSFDVSF
jgi:hypothetical protein